MDGRGLNFDLSQKWLRRHCGDFYHLYCEAFLEQVWKWCTLTIYLIIMSLHWPTFDFYLGQKILSSPHMYKFPKSSTFDSQEVTGRCLVRMTENSLMRLGIIHPEHRYTWFRAEKVNTHDAQYFRQFIWREIAKLRLRSSILYLRDQANLTFFYVAKYSLNRVFIIATTDNETLCRSGDWPAVSRLADNILKSINMQCHQNTKALLL